MIDLLMSNLQIIVPAVWASFSAYVLWYVGKAKDYSPINPTEARQLWTIHRKTVNCNGKRWRQITRRGRTIGFECECGHRHLQRRPIVTGAPMARIESESSVFDRLHTSHKSN
jgi:hypothetical protein